MESKSNKQCSAKRIGSNALSSRDKALLLSIIGACEEIVALANSAEIVNVQRILDIAEARFFNIGEDFYSTGEGHTEYLGRVGDSVLVDTRPIKRISDLRAQLRRFNRKCNGLGFVVIESLQQLSETICTEESGISRDALLRTIEALAREVSVPVLLVSPQTVRSG